MPPEFSTLTLSILIVNWNTRDLLRECLSSLHEHLGQIDHEIIVVDNASHDNSAAMVRCDFPNVTLMESSENLGFAAGNNRAYELARGRWIWLLNPDTQVLADSCEVLIEWLEAHPECGAAASALIDARDGTTQSSCRTFPVPLALWCQALGLAQRYRRSKRFGFYRMGWWKHDDTRRVEQPMASSLMLRRAAIEDIGALFDERFAIFFNDVDLCWRLSEKKWQIWFVHTSRVLHWGGASTRQVKAEMISESHQSLSEFYRLHFRNRLHPSIYGATMLLIGVTRRARVLSARTRKKL